jgi:alpha-tubulin suppressor-like RCC1 family protein
MARVRATTTKARLSRWVFGAIVPFAAVASVTCAAPTEIDVTVFTDLPCTEASAFGVVVGNALGELGTGRASVTTRGCAGGGRVGTFVLAPAGDKGAPIAFEVVTRADGKSIASCTKPGYAGCVVARRALDFVPRESVPIRIDLRAACLDRPCGASETCVGGACVPATCASPEACADEAALRGGRNGGRGDAGSDASGGGDAGGLAIVDIAPGDGHTCVLWSDGAVQCFGANDEGQLGLGDTVSRGAKPADMGKALPLVDLGGQRARSIASGVSFTCAALDDGTARCWGRNDLFQLGTGASGASVGTRPEQMGAALRPVAFPEGAGRARQVAAGAAHACALAEGGTYCWGRGRDVIARQDLSIDLRTIASSPAAGHTCGVGTSLSGPNGVCWGPNSVGQIDPAKTMAEAVVLGFPAAVADVTAVAVGDLHSCALAASGASLACWGTNIDSQLGSSDSNALRVTTPVADVTSIAGGFFETCFARSTVVTCFGRTKGTYDFAPRRVARLRLGYRFACALLEDGALSCWGENGDGQLGVGSAAAILGFDPSRRALLAR